MEAKSIGAFLCVLRKANGFTQQEVADKLNVSNKTISNWERDESSPDLSLIPVLAELYGVTCDEILRGERLSAEEVSASPSSLHPKVEQQVVRLLDRALSEFYSLSYVSIGLMALGVIGLFICAYGFYKVVLGFGLMCICLIISILCQLYFTNHAVSAVEQDEFNEDKINTYKEAVINRTFSLFFTACYVLCFTMPFIIVRDSYYTDSVISFSSWIYLTPLYIIFGTFFSMLLNIVKKNILNNILKTRDNHPMKEEISDNRKKKLKLRVLSFIITVLIMIITFSVHQTVAAISPYDFSKGKTFDSFEAFKTYMETRYPNEYDSWVWGEETFEMNGIEYSFDWQNGNVATYYLNEEADGSLRFITHTYEDKANGEFWIELICGILYFLYYVEIFAGFYVYYKEQKKLK